MSASAITLETLDEIESIALTGVTTTAAIESLGLKRDSFYYALQRLNVDRKRFDRVEIFKRRLEPYLDALTNTTMTARAVAAELNCSYAYLIKILKQLGVKLNKGAAVSLTKAQHLASKYSVIHQYILTKGGTVPDALRAVGLPTHLQKPCRKYLRSIDFPYDEYRYAFREYGHWTILPCIAKQSAHKGYDLLVKARCNLCGTTYEEVSFNNLQTGASTCCKSCGHGRKVEYEVRCLEDGRTWTSIHDWIRCIDTEDYSEQKLRRQVRSEGGAVVDDYHYVATETKRYRSAQREPALAEVS